MFHLGNYRSLGSFLHEVRELRDARQFAGTVAEEEVEVLQRRLMAGHILSESDSELHFLRMSGRAAS